MDNDDHFRWLFLGDYSKKDEDMSDEDDFKSDEIINVRLPRKDYEVMRQMIRERETMNNITAILKSSWVWVVVSGAIALITLWDTIKIKVGG